MVDRLFEEASKVPLSLYFLAIGAAWWTVGAEAEVEFTPEVTVGVAHTDNLTLSPDDPEAETVYELIPAFTLSQHSPRLTTNAAYRLEGYYYKNRQDSSTYHQFDGEFTGALDPDNFFLDLGASRGQSIRDPSAPIARSNLPIDNNRVNRDDYYAGLHFTYPVGANVTVQANDRRGWTRFDDAPPGSGALFVNDFVDDTVTFSIDNYRKIKGFSWALRYEGDKTDYDIGKPWEHREAALELGAWLPRSFRIFATGGKESAWDRPLDPSLEDGFWEVGFSNQAGQNFTAEVAAGHRSFGRSFRASLSTAFMKMHTELSYTEQPTTTNRDRYTGLLQPELPEDLLAGLGEAERYILKRLALTAGYDLFRTSIALSAFNEQRADRTTLDGTPVPDERQDGVTVSATWRAGVRTDFVLSADTGRREFASGETRDLSGASLAVGHRVGTRTEARLEYGRTKDEGSDGGAGYTNDVISLMLTRTFER